MLTSNAEGEGLTLKSEESGAYRLLRRWGDGKMCPIRKTWGWFPRANEECLGWRQKFWNWMFGSRCWDYDI